MNISEIDGVVTRVQLRGRLDAPGADQIGLRFTSAVTSAGRDAIIDLAGLEFIASLGLRLLISNARALGNKGAKLVLFGAPELVQNVFDDAALDQIITIVRTEADALAALGR
jgi:anti-anti-sigma factor